MTFYQSNRYPLLFICCLLLGMQSLLAQSRKAYERAGDAAYSQKDYGSAIQHYATILTQKPSNIKVQWKYAECAHLFYALPIAEKAYMAVAEDAKGVKKFPLVHFRLAEVKKKEGNYTAAIDYFNRFLAENHQNIDSYIQKAQSEITTCQWAQNQSATTLSATVTNLGNKINSPYSDFAAVGKGDSLFFSSYRFEQRKSSSEPRGHLTKMMLSVRGAKAKEIRGGFPAGDSAHVAHAAFTPDGKHVIFTFCKNVNAFDIRCELWMITQDIRGKWTKPERLPEPVNQRNYTSTQPNISRDAHSDQLRLWFSSDRPGGKGALDIWSVPLDTNWFCTCNLPIDYRKPQRLPRFVVPQPVAVINTPENDATPFYHRPSQTLYFSSEGLPGFGGYDVFKSVDHLGVFSAPENAGAGLNSSYNDVYFSLNSNGQAGYISSNRPGSMYLDASNKACCNDIYGVQLPVPKVPVQPTGKDSIPVLSKSPDISLPLVPPIAVQPPQLIDFVGLPLYFDNDEPDKRTRKITTKRSYEETVLEYLDRQQEYREQRAGGLKNDKADQAASEVDLFFDNEVRQGYDRLSQLCELVLSRLEAGAEMEIIIKGFTSPRAQSDYNVNLGRRRISSVRNHFEAYENGALMTYIQNGHLKISEASFGETTARAGISDDLNDVRNSIYAPDAARERRVEIVEIKQK